MSRRWMKLSMVFLSTAVRAFLRWHNQPLSIQHCSVSPEIINLDQQIAICVLAQGAGRFEAKADAGKLS